MVLTPRTEADLKPLEEAAEHCQQVFLMEMARRKVRRDTAIELWRALPLAKAMEVLTDYDLMEHHIKEVEAIPSVEPIPAATSKAPSHRHQSPCQETACASKKHRGDTWSTVQRVPPLNIPPVAPAPFEPLPPPPAPSSHPRSESRPKSWGFDPSDWNAYPNMVATTAVLVRGPPILLSTPQI